MSDTTSFQLEVDQGLMTVKFLPRLNQLPWADIEQVGSQVVQRIHGMPNPRVLVDLTPLDYMGSAQVALIVRLFKGVKEKSGSMAVAAPHPVVQEVLTLAGLNKIWAITSSLGEARSQLGSGAGSTIPADSSSTGLAMAAGLAGAVVGGLALAAFFAKVSFLPPTAAAWIAALAAAAAFAMGLIATLKTNGRGRNLGVGILVVGVAMLLGSVYALANPNAIPAGASQKSDGEDAAKAESESDNGGDETARETSRNSSKKS